MLAPPAKSYYYFSLFIDETLSRRKLVGGFRRRVRMSHIDTGHPPQSVQLHVTLYIREYLL